MFICYVSITLSCGHDTSEITLVVSWWGLFLNNIPAHNWRLAALHNDNVECFLLLQPILLINFPQKDKDLAIRTVDVAWHAMSAHQGSQSNLETWWFEFYSSRSRNNLELAPKSEKTWTKKFSRKPVKIYNISVLYWDNFFPSFVLLLF